MSTEYPITPPPELVREWLNDFHSPSPGMAPGEATLHIATQAARWGADVELEACCEWLSVPCPSYGRELRAIRRPKPPSLAEEALAEFKEIMYELHGATGSGLTASAIHRALERLQELEQGNG